MKINSRNISVRLLSLTLILFSVLSFISHSGKTVPGFSPVNVAQEAKLSALTETDAAYSLNSGPVNVPAPTVNNISNSGQGTASYNPVAAVVFMHDSGSEAGLFSFSGNPVFPYALNSPRLHLACMVLRI